MTTKRITRGEADPLFEQSDRPPLIREVRVAATVTIPSEGAVATGVVSLTNRPVRLIPGHNVDKIDVAAGLRELTACGYDDPKTIMVIEYALMRWARGEEAQAEHGAIDGAFHGINLTCWRRVLAAAMAHAETV